MFNLMTDDKKKLSPLGNLWMWAIILTFVGVIFNTWINRPYRTNKVLECSLDDDSWVTTQTRRLQVSFSEDRTPLPLGHYRTVGVVHLYRGMDVRFVTADDMERVTCQPYVIDE